MSDTTDQGQGAGRSIAVLTAVVMCLFLGVAAYFGDESLIAPSQPDAVVYHRYARSIAEGHPFCFAASDAPTTGCTGHLYVFILACAAAAGVSVPDLAGISFLLGICFYLIFLYSFRRVAVRMDSRAATPAMTLVILNGYVAFTAFGQSDMSLFMALSASAFAFALEKRFAALGATLLLASLARPEGILLSVIWLVKAGYDRFRGNDTDVSPLLAGLAGLAGMVAVILVNIYFTGHAAFDSLNGKGLYRLPMLQAMSAIAAHGVRFISEIVIGIAGNGSWRTFFWPTCIGGLMLICGLGMKARTERPEAGVESWFVGTMVAQMLLIIVSGWQGAAYDRYLGWIVPFFILYQTIGIIEVSERLAAPRLKTLLFAAFAGWQLFGMSHFLSLSAEGCRRMVEEKQFCMQVARVLPRGTRIGLYDEYHFAAWLDGLRPVAMAGIFTPGIPVDDPGNIEYLKHHKEMRFPAMIVSGPTAGRWISRIEGRKLPVPSPLVSPGRPVPRLCETSLEALENAVRPVCLPQIASASVLELSDRLDVGFAEDEARCGYEVGCRQPGLEMMPFAVTATCSGMPVCEVGRAIAGWEEFRVRAKPGKDMLMIMRIGGRAFIETRCPTGVLERDIGIASGALIGIAANGAPLESVIASVDEHSENMKEVTVRIPGGLIRGPLVHFLISGDHLSYAYWFYQ